MLTVKFEPTDSVLVANLIASANEVTRGETLIHFMFDRVLIKFTQSTPQCYSYA